MYIEFLIVMRPRSSDDDEDPEKEIIYIVKFS